MTTSNLHISQDEQRLTEEILDIGATLIDPKTEDLTRVDERRFVAVFLPMFAGDAEQPYLNHGANIDTWRKIAGGPNKEVVIIADNGGELFRVPPLFDMEALQPLGTTNIGRGIPSISDMLARANLIAKQGKRAYDTFVEDELARRSFMFSDKKHEDEYIERWNAIFTRYNRPLISKTPTGSATIVDQNNNGRPTNSDGDEFEPVDA